MAFTSVKINSRKLDSLIREQNKNVAMVAAELDVSLGTMWRWLKGPTAGVDPRRFHKMLQLFAVSAEALKDNAASPSDIDAAPDAQIVLEQLRVLIGQGLLTTGQVISEARKAAAGIAQGKKAKLPKIRAAKGKSKEKR